MLLKLYRLDQKEGLLNHHLEIRVQLIHLTDHTHQVKFYHIQNLLSMQYHQRKYLF